MVVKSRKMAGVVGGRLIRLLSLSLEGGDWEVGSISLGFCADGSPFPALPPSPRPGAVGFPLEKEGKKVENGQVNNEEKEEGKGEGEGEVEGNKSRSSFEPVKPVEEMIHSAKHSAERAWMIRHVEILFAPEADWG